MIVDVYSIGKEIQKNLGPHLISFEHAMIDPQRIPYGEYLPIGVLSELGSLFFMPSELTDNRTMKLKNWLKRRIEFDKNRTSLQAMVTEKLPEAIKFLQECRGPVIRRYGVESRENQGMMQFQDYVRGMLHFFTYALKNRRDLFAVTHNANPQYRVQGADGKVLCLPRKSTTVSAGCACGIHGARINTVDTETRTYTGTIDMSDGLENFSGTDPWIAHPIPQEVEFEYQKDFYIRRPTGNFLTGGCHFTLISEVDEAFREYIYPMIAETEKAMSPPKK